MGGGVNESLTIRVWEDIKTKKRDEGEVVKIFKKRDVVCKRPQNLKTDILNGRL